MSTREVGTSSLWATRSQIFEVGLGGIWMGPDVLVLTFRLISSTGQHMLLHLNLFCFVGIQSNFCPESGSHELGRQRQATRSTERVKKQLVYHTSCCATWPFHIPKMPCNSSHRSCVQSTRFRGCEPIW